MKESITVAEATIRTSSLEAFLSSSNCFELLAVEKTKSRAKATKSVDLRIVFPVIRIRNVITSGIACVAIKVKPWFMTQYQSFVREISVYSAQQKAIVTEILSRSEVDTND